MKNSTLAALSLAIIPVVQSPAAQDAFQHRGDRENFPGLAVTKPTHGSGCGNRLGGKCSMGGGGKSCCANKNADASSAASGHKSYEDQGQPKSQPDHAQHSH